MTARRTIRRCAAAVLVLGLLGPVRPVVTSMVVDRFGERPRPAARIDLPVAEYGESQPVAGAVGWSASVQLDGPPEAVRAPKPPPKHKRTALIVGINRAVGGSPLPGSVTDAKNLRSSLLGYGFRSKNVKMLLEKDASAAAIREELARLARRTPKDGVAVFAVATHTRRRGGQNELLTADGQRISASELGAALSKVRSKMWVALPTCYAGGYAVPGIVGKNRVATFASSSTQPTYQLGNAGSYLIIHMVRQAMLEGNAHGSVEDAFGYAEDKLTEEYPDRVPTMRDGVKGDLVLGSMSEATIRRHRERARAREAGSQGQEVTFAAESGPSDRNSGSYDDPREPQSTPDPNSNRRRGIRVCGKFDYRCGPAPTPYPTSSP